MEVSNKSNVKKIKLSKTDLNLVPIYESNVSFHERSEEVKDLIAKLILMSRKRGRPSIDSGEEFQDAA